MTMVYVGIFLLVALGLGVFWGQMSVRSARRRGIYPSKGQATMNDVRRLALNGDVVLAMRAYREIHGGSLKDAKDAVGKIAPAEKDRNRRPPDSEVES